MYMHPMDIVGPVTGRVSQGFLPSLTNTPVGHGTDTTVLQLRDMRKRLGLPVGYRMGAARVRGAVVGPPPRLIPTCISDLYSYMVQPGDRQVKGWYAACFLLSVHPWADGNGRTGRYLYRRYTGSTESTDQLRARFGPALEHLQQQVYTPKY